MQPDKAQPAALIDTSVVARYLLLDVPDLAAKAAAVIDSDRPLRVSLVVLAELGFLLTRRYNLDRHRVVDALADLLGRQNVEAYEVPTDLAVEALGLCRPSGRVSFADAMLWAVARHAGSAPVWTFDASFPADGIVRMVP